MKKLTEHPMICVLLLQKAYSPIVVHIIIFHNKSKCYDGIHAQIVHAPPYWLEGHKGSLKHTIFFFTLRTATPGCPWLLPNDRQGCGGWGGVRGVLVVLYKALAATACVLINLEVDQNAATKYHAC
jgi:hypothetical protein